MSLDVYLEGPEQEVECTCKDCEHRHTRKTRERYYDANITHNLGRMAREAGIYEVLWRPEELEITTAWQLIAPLAAGLEKLRADPEKFSAFNASNGWGMYEHFVPFVAKYLDACIKNPDASVSVSR